MSDMGALDSGGSTRHMMLSRVSVQITPGLSPSLPSWVGEVAAFAQVLTHAGILNAIQNQVCFVRFGQYDLIDFSAVLIGYVLVFRADLAGLSCL